MSYSSHKLSVRDSFDDEDISDDVEDEVFIRDGRNGFRSNEERGVKRPLMAPKRKLKSGLLHSEPCKTNSWKVWCIPCCYGIVALTALIGLIAAAVGLVLWLPLSMDQVVFWKQRVAPTMGGSSPCTGLRVQDVWTASFPKLTLESGLVLSDVNGDQVADVIVGYGTGFIEFIVEPSMGVCSDMLESILGPIHSSCKPQELEAAESISDDRDAIREKNGAERMKADVKMLKSTVSSPERSARFKIKKPWTTCLAENKKIWKEQAARDAEIRAREQQHSSEKDESAEIEE